MDDTDLSPIVSEFEITDVPLHRCYRAVRDGAVRHQRAGAGRGMLPSAGLGLK